jgi:hypothetical protein
MPGYGESTYGSGIYGVYSAVADVGEFANSVWNILNLQLIVPDGDDNGTHLTLLYLGALSAAFNQMDDLAHIETGDDGTIYPQWSKLLDIDRIPDEGLQWFGQFTGVTVDSGLAPSDQRQQILKHGGWARGTYDGIQAAVQAKLIDTKTVLIAERDTSAYHFAISTYSSETPDPNQVLSAINATKPAGVQFSYSVITGIPGTTNYQAIYIDDNSYTVTMSENTSYEDLYITEN